MANAVRERDLSAIPRTIGEEYRAIREDQTAAQRAFQQENPRQALAADSLGAIVGGGKVAGAVNRLAPRAFSTARGAGAVAAAEGGAFAAGAAEGNVLDRLDEAATGAVIGGVGGMAFQRVANSVQNYARSRAGKAVASQDTRDAFSLVRRVMAEDKGSRPEAEAFLRQWVRQGARPDELFDELAKGGVGRTVAREIATRNPTPALKFIDDFRSTQAEQLRRGASSVLRNGKTVRATRKTLEDIRKTQATPLYERAYANDAFSPELDQLIADRGSIRNAMRIAANRVSDRGNATTRGISDIPTMEVYDRAKGVLDDRINVLLKNGATRHAGDIKSARNEFVRLLDEVNPDYAKARSVWAGTADIDDAMELGEKFTRPSYTADDLADDLAGLNSSQREFHRVAVAEQLEELIDRTRDNANLARFVKTEAMRKKLRTLFADNADEGEAFIRVLQDSAEKFDRRSFIDPRTGSQTEPRRRGQELLADAAQGRITRGALNATQNPLGVPREAFNLARRQAVEARTQRISEVIAKAIFEGADDPFVTGAPNVRIPVGAELNAIAQNRE